uniref:C2H2-type domain-containing protein n=1 Tax=Labrus bergylta TaxID=56723 RepID=A0A3Q3FVD2_9LABR
CFSAPPSEPPQTCPQRPPPGLLPRSHNGASQMDHFSDQNLVYQSINTQNQNSLSQEPSLHFTCSICSRRFSHHCKLRIHERAHTGEKPHKCPQCDKRFGQMCSLKRHQMVHTGERPFPCPHCGKTFATSTNLKVHQSVHTGERRFNCSKCGKNFSFLSNLIRHQALHHKVISPSFVDPHENSFGVLFSVTLC